MEDYIINNSEEIFKLIPYYVNNFKINNIICNNLFIKREAI